MLLFVYCVYVCIYLCACIHVCRVQRLISGISLSHFEQGAPETHLSPPLTSWESSDQRWAILYHTFTWELGIQLMLTGYCSLNMKCSPHLCVWALCPEQVMLWSGNPKEVEPCWKKWVTGVDLYNLAPLPVHSLFLESRCSVTAISHAMPFLAQ